MLDNATLQKFKQRLLDEQARLQEQINRATQEVRDDTGAQAIENAYSNHMADDAGFLEDIDRTTSIRETFQTTLEQVNHALEKIENGTYGLSDVSGAEIPVERLEVVPWANTLVGEEATR
ncbi:MAG TPA: TraR/DksA family transcriptional regulator [Chloroflexia bacterium]|nr:TraR/DksA family transcriptional regulator [Chloroflexia bacterium]